VRTGDAEQMENTVLPAGGARLSDPLAGIVVAGTDGAGSCGPADTSCC
jgi:hypothetical protein